MSYFHQKSGDLLVMLQMEPLVKGFASFEGSVYLGNKEATPGLSHRFQLVSFFSVLASHWSLLPASLYVIHCSIGPTTQDVKPAGLGSNLSINSG